MGTLAKSGSLTQPFMFSTKRYDQQTGLYDYGFRFYAPVIGRWTTRDPLDEAGGLNLYAFVGNNPVNWVDPWGLTAADIAVTFLDDVVGVSLPSIGTGVLVNGVTAGLGALLGNMIFPSPVGVGSDVIPLPTLPMSPSTIAPTSFSVPLAPVCEIRRGPRPWEERHPKTTPPFISKKPSVPIEPRTPGKDVCDELWRIIHDPDSSWPTKLKATILYYGGGCHTL